MRCALWCGMRCATAAPPWPARAVVFIVVCALEGHENADRSERSTHTLLEQMRRAAPLPAEPAKSKRIEKHGLPPDRLNADSGPGPSSTSAKTVLRSRLAPARPYVPPGQRSYGNRRPSRQICLPRGCARFVSRETICNPGAARRHHCLVGSGKSKDNVGGPGPVGRRGMSLTMPPGHTVGYMVVGSRRSRSFMACPVSCALPCWPRGA